MPTAADIRKLANRLAPRAGAGARLTPESEALAMVALRVYADLLEPPSIETLGRPSWRWAKDSIKARASSSVTSSRPSFRAIGRQNCFDHQGMAGSPRANADNCKCVIWLS
jgi:hypothetical protein